MKQFQIAYNDEKSFLMELKNFKKKCEEDGMSKIIFQIFSRILKKDAVDTICNTIEQVFPDVPYFGCSTSGNIMNCQVASEISVAAICFEYESTRFRILQYDLSKTPVEEVTQHITTETEKNPWIKAMEMYFSILDWSASQFCDGLSRLRKDIHMFGGVACSIDITSDACCVFSKDCGYSDKSIIVVLYGGEDFYVESIKLTGWKTIGRDFCVTKADRNILYELNGVPAYDVYNKYLGIGNDENFFYNALEFPLIYEDDGFEIIKAPAACNPDRSIIMSSDIKVGSTLKISYGDPKTILRTILEGSQKIKKFNPDLIHIFSCAARVVFWSSNEPTYELNAFKDIAPSNGFFSHGEYIRENNKLTQNNVTLVVSAMREGGSECSDIQSVVDSQTTFTKVPLVSRMATFISETFQELEDINRRLEVANRNLKNAAITDGLTGLYNRTEIQSRIERSLENVKEEKISIIMLDIDNFKQVNDNYGHQEGDSVIIALSNILRNEQTKSSTKFSAGRWGGEEFMLLLEDTDLSAASLIAELIRQCFENTTFPSIRSQTVSIGVTQAKENDTIDSLCTRVDDALYHAKKTGKNKVVIE